MKTYVRSIAFLNHGFPRGRRGLSSNVPSTLLLKHKDASTHILKRFLGNFHRLEEENLKVGHARFISEAGVKDRWANGVRNDRKGGEEASSREVEGLDEGKGKLVPTSTHLFKIILPLYSTVMPSSKSEKPIYTVFLLHPSQPLSHLARLIASSLSPTIPAISFRSASPADLEESDAEVEWSDSTDLGNFIRNAVSDEHFHIILTPQHETHEAVPQNETDSVEVSVKSDVNHLGETETFGPAILPNQRVITIQVPSFKDRTQFLRRRLHSIEIELKRLEKLKDECDAEAHRGARRMAMGGFGALVVYWLGVARLTFYDFGWDIMEPITYLSGLSTVICGYLWFLYKGREVSYTSVLSQSVSTRRISLYKARGFDMERWADLLSEQRSIREEMNKIAEDYDIQWDGSLDINGGNGKNVRQRNGGGGGNSTQKEQEKELEKERIKEKLVKPDIVPRNEIGSAHSEEGPASDKKRLEELERMEKSATNGSEKKTTP